MQNFPVDYIDKESGEKKTAWISRSVAVSGFIFCKDQNNKWYVLANQRGEGTPDFQGYWNCICGYLDYDENTNQALKREICEETGLDVRSTSLIPYFVNSNPKENRQNVTIRFYSILKGDITKWMNFSTDKMEKNEVANIRWISIDDISQYNWAFGHEDLIKYTYNTFINIPFWKHWIINWYNKNIIWPLVAQTYG